MFAYGHQAICLFVGFVIGYALFYLFARKFHAESPEKPYYTMADCFEAHFGPAVGPESPASCR